MTTIWRRCFLLAILLSTGLLYGTPATEVPSSHVPAYLFVIDTSDPMAVHKEAISKAVAGRIKNGLQGKMRAGEAVSIWGCNDAVSVVRHFTAAWDPRGAQNIAARVASGLETEPFSGNPCLDRAMEEASKLIASTDSLTLIILNNGASPVSGTPFDAKIHAACRPANSDDLFTTTLVARGGRFIGWSVDRLPSGTAKATSAAPAQSGKSPAPVWTREGGAAPRRSPASSKIVTTARDSLPPENQRVVAQSVSVAQDSDVVPQPVVRLSPVPPAESFAINRSALPAADVDVRPQDSKPHPEANSRVQESVQAVSEKPRRGELPTGSAQESPVAVKPEPPRASNLSPIPAIQAKPNLAENAAASVVPPAKLAPLIESAPVPAPSPSPSLSATPRQVVALDSATQNATLQAPPAVARPVPPLPAPVSPNLADAQPQPEVHRPAARAVPQPRLPNARGPEAAMSAAALPANWSSSILYLLAGLALLSVALAGMWFWMRPRGVINHPSLISQSLDSPP